MGRPEHIDTCTYEEFKDMVNDPNVCIIFDLQLSKVKVREGMADSYLTNDT